jgi:hypothetical protein
LPNLTAWTLFQSSDPNPFFAMTPSLPERLNLGSEFAKRRAGTDDDDAGHLPGLNG